MSEVSHEHGPRKLPQFGWCESYTCMLTHVHGLSERVSWDRHAGLLALLRNRQTDFGETTHPSLEVSCRGLTTPSCLPKMIPID